MPAVIPFAIQAVATALGASELVAGVLALASAAVIGNVQARQAGKKARAEYNAAQVDRMANVVTSVNPRELVLGRVRKGGGVAFRGSAGQYKQKFFVHLAIAAHEIDAIEEIWFNDQRVDIDPNTREVLTAPYSRIDRVSSTPVKIVAGSTSFVLPADPVGGSVSAAILRVEEVSTPVPFTVSGRTVTIPVQTEDTTVFYQGTQRVPLAWVYLDLGAPGSAANANTKFWFPELWTDAHRGQGIAKVIIEFEYSDTAYPNGVPTVTAIVRGAKVYDPRTGVTGWSENPALLMRHVYQHPQFGKTTPSAAEDARFIAAANACDLPQTWVVGGVATPTVLYRAGLVTQFGAQPASALDDLAQAMGGRWVFAGGELYLQAGVYTAPVMTFTDADLAVVQRTVGNGADQEQQSPIKISVHRERVDKFNVVNARIWDSQQDFKQAALAPLKGAALIARDGEELAQEVELAAVPIAPQALHICGVMMRDARDPLTVEVPLKMRAYPVEIFDTVQFAFTRYGWSVTPKTCVVVGRVWDPANGVVRLTCKETSAAIYTPDAAFLPQGYAQNTALPNPWEISPPGTLVVSSGSSELLIGADGTIVTRVHVSWPAIDDQRITQGGKVELQWAVAATAAWNSILVDGAVTDIFITGLSDGMAILLRARTRTDLASSSWGVQQLHVVLGKTQPPGVPTGVSITQEFVFFQPPADLDLAGVRIRSLPGVVSAPVFSRGTDVISGIVRSSPARIEQRLYGVQTLVVVAEDTSGNQSDPAYAVLDFGQPDVDSAVWTRIFANEAFKGTFTACTLSGGAVAANVDPSSDLYPLDNLYGEPDVYATLYVPMMWQADMVIPPYSGTLALTFSVGGNSPAVEYRVSGDTVTDLYASGDCYTPPDLYGAPSDWVQWPGALQVVRATPLDLRVSVGAGSERGMVSTFTLSLIMDDVAQTFTNITVDAAGTRLVPSQGKPPRSWVGSLRSVYGWPAVDGSGAIAGRVLDYSPVLGPLVQFVNTAGVAVTAIGTIKVEGNSDG